MKLDQYEKELVTIAEEIVFYLMKSGVSMEDSQDVVQDVLLKMLENNFVLPREKIRAWMYRVAIRNYIDLYRRGKKYQEIIQSSFFQEGLSHYDQERGSEVYGLIQKLPIQYRLVLDLHYFQGFSVKEISHILSCSHSKVKIDLMRARHQLKAIIKKRGLTYEDLI